MISARAVCWPAADDIAGIDQGLAHLAVERRPDFGIAEIQLGEHDLGLGVEQLGFCRCRS